MAFYDKGGRKIGRNDLCSCGSGLKFKKCACRSKVKKEGFYIEDIPTEVLNELNRRVAEDNHFRENHGLGRPIVSLEFNDQRVVSVGNELYFGKKEVARFFPDFLEVYILTKLGKEWIESELAKPSDEKHQVIKWFVGVEEFKAQVISRKIGGYKISANGALLSWMRLAYDLYLIKHNSILQEKILDRLRNKDQFQGARFELCVIAAMIVAGYEIFYEDESDTSRKHPEFLAKDKLGNVIAVEAKSRHRFGVLDFKASSLQVNRSTERVAVENLINKALKKKPEYPYIIFVDVNLPYCEGGISEHPWIKEISDSIEALQDEYSDQDFPANAVLFCNDPTYHDLEKVPKDTNYWVYEFSISNPKFKVDDIDISGKIAKAIIQRSKVPNEYPKE